MLHFHLYLKGALHIRNIAYAHDVKLHSTLQTQAAVNIHIHPQDLRVTSKKGSNIDTQVREILHSHIKRLFSV